MCAVVQRSHCRLFESTSDFIYIFWIKFAPEIQRESSVTRSTALQYIRSEVIHFNLCDHVPKASLINTTSKVRSQV